MPEVGHMDGRIPRWTGFPTRPFPTPSCSIRLESCSFNCHNTLAPIFSDWNATEPSPRWTAFEEKALDSPTTTRPYTAGRVHRDLPRDYRSLPPPHPPSPPTPPPPSN